MSRRATTLAALAASGILATAVLTGCSSSDSTGTATSAAAAVTEAASSAAGEGSTSMLPPVIITEDQTEATAKVGDNLDIVIAADKLAGTTVSTSTPDLVELTQATEEDGVTFNAGGKALAAGVATIEVTNPDSSVRTITLTITE